eukprot:c19073_g1_i3 orf=556-945(+)
MTVPGKAVSKKRGKEEKPPLYKKSCQDKRSSNQCSIKVPASGGSLCVLVHVKGPELFQISEVHPQGARKQPSQPPSSELKAKFVYTTNRTSTLSEPQNVPLSQITCIASPLPSLLAATAAATLGLAWLC